MSRPMRKAAGLPSPEEAVGQSAHDFVMASCSAPIAVLSCPRRRDGAPAVPARWLARLDACLVGQRTSLPKHPATDWARLLDQPAGPARPVRPPAPKPPVAIRPRRLSVTEIETWSADPYAIYAKHILKLRKLKPLEEATDASDYGSIVHKGFQIFLQQSGIHWTAKSRDLLREAMRLALLEAHLRPALVEWWTPRLDRISDWVADTEIERHARRAPLAIGTERAGRLELQIERGFALTGRADRIEMFADGTLAILDYKTGAPPPKSRVASGAAPQLTLEAAMAARGGFGPEWAGRTSELVYWHVSGGHEPGKATPLFDGNEAAIADAADEALGRLRDRIIAFDDADCAYLAQPHPGLRPRFPDYAQLARVDEWDLGEEGE
jgi:ATP-dependent helicase/nuclease subunit B